MQAWLVLVWVRGESREKTVVGNQIEPAKKKKSTEKQNLGWFNLFDQARLPLVMVKIKLRTEQPTKFHLFPFYLSQLCKQKSGIHNSEPTLVN